MDENPYKVPDTESREFVPAWRQWIVEIASLSAAGLAISGVLGLLALIALWWILPRLIAWWLEWWLGSGGQLSGA
jgi:hypothetical protein